MCLFNFEKKIHSEYRRKLDIGELYFPQRTAWLK